MSDIQKSIGEVMLILNEAKCEEIDGKRCFVLKPDRFYRVRDLVVDWDSELEGDVRLFAAGWNNFSLILSAADQERYAVVSKAEPMLDSVWQKKKG